VTRATDDAGLLAEQGRELFLKLEIRPLEAVVRRRIEHFREVLVAPELLE